MLSFQILPLPRMCPSTDSPDIRPKCKVTSTHDSGHCMKNHCTREPGFFLECPRLQLNKPHLPVFAKSPSTFSGGTSGCPPVKERSTPRVNHTSCLMQTREDTGVSIWSRIVTLLSRAPNSIRVEQTMDRFKSCWILLKAKHSSHTHNIVLVLRVPIT